MFDCVDKRMLLCTSFSSNVSHATIEISDTFENTLYPLRVLRAVYQRKVLMPTAYLMQGVQIAAHED